MSTKRLTLELTEAQFRALGGAVALAEVDWAEMGLSTKALLAGWEKLRKAWHRG